MSIVALREGDGILYRTEGRMRAKGDLHPSNVVDCHLRSAVREQHEVGACMHAYVGHKRVV